jgi:hypothetical protein
MSEERIELNVRWAVLDVIQPFEAESRDDVNAFFRVLAGPGGSVSVSPHPFTEDKFGAMIADALGRPVAIVDITVIPPKRRPMREGPASWFGE